MELTRNGWKRVVVTGMGAVTPLGRFPAFWERLKRGESGIRRIQAFDPSNLEVQIAGEVLDFDPTEYLDAKEARRMARASQFGVTAALDGRSHGILDNWLRLVKDVAAKHDEYLAALEPEQRHRRLVELNAVEQARNLCHTSIVQAAWARGQALTVRAWVYGLEDGVLRDLGFVVNGPEDMQPSYRLTLEDG